MENRINYKNKQYRESGTTLKERVDNLARKGLVAKPIQADMSALGPLVSDEYKKLYKRDAHKEKRKEGGNLYRVKVYPKDFVAIMDTIILNYFASKPAPNPEEEESNTGKTVKKRKRILKPKSIKLGSSDSD